MLVLILQQLWYERYKALQVYWLYANLLAEAILAEKCYVFHKVGDEVWHLHVAL